MEKEKTNKQNCGVFVWVAVPIVEENATVGT